MTAKTQRFALIALFVAASLGLRPIIGKASEIQTSNISSSTSLTTDQPTDNDIGQYLKIKRQYDYLATATPITDKNYEENDKALAVLKPLLFALFGNETFKGITPTTVTTLPDTLVNEIGLGCNDGILYTFSAGSKNNLPASIFVSDIRLLTAEAKHRGDAPDFNIENSASWKDTLFYIACDNSAHYQVMKIDSGIKDVYAYVNIAAQDIGPFVPNELIVLRQKGPRVYVVQYDIASFMPTKDKCANAFRKATKRIDPKNEEEEYSKYLACYEKDFRQTSSFNKLKKIITFTMNLLP